MAVRDILKMGDPRLLRIAQPIDRFDTPELHALVADMFDTMEAARGAGLAAPQIGVDLQLVIFGFTHSERYPDAPAVPRTVLVNPRVVPTRKSVISTSILVESSILYADRIAWPPPRIGGNLCQYLAMLAILVTI